MKRIWLLRDASSVFPSQLRAALVIPPSGDDERVADEYALADLGVEDLVAEHHRDLVMDLGTLALPGLLTPAVSNLPSWLECRSTGRVSRKSELHPDVLPLLKRLAFVSVNRLRLR
jgi:hypothetical protein